MIFEPAKITKPIFIITGMHRSGTSLTASLLESAGVDIGQNLIQGNEGNIKGYFEDIDLVQFHEQVLLSQGFSQDGWILEKTIHVQEQYLVKAQEIITNKLNLDSPFFGWKDPRTTLFLPFWEQFLPTAFFLLIYRSPWEVVDSLYRRGLPNDEIFKSNPNLAIQAWLNYNQIILDFSEQFPEKCLILSIDTIIANPLNLIEAIKLKYNLELNNVEDLYEPSLFNGQVINWQRLALFKDFFPETLELYAKIAQKEYPILANKKPWHYELSQVTSYKPWICQDWLDYRVTEKKLKNTHTQLNQKNLDLQNALNQIKIYEVEITEKENQIQQLQHQLEDNHRQFEHSQTQLQETDQKLQQTQLELESTQIQLEANQRQFETAQIQLYEIQTQLQQTESELEITHIQLEASQSQLQQTESKLNMTQTQLTENQSILTATQAQLEAIQLELANLYEQLESTQIEFQSNQHLIKAMESSKFWKLRKMWFNLKKTLRLAKDDE